MSTTIAPHSPRLIDLTWRATINDPRPTPPPEFKFGLWTGNNFNTWPDPPSLAQIGVFSNIFTHGGPNPLLPTDRVVEPRLVPAKTPIFLDAEGRSLSSIYASTNTFLSMLYGHTPDFSIYGLAPHDQADVSMNWLAENQLAWIVSFERRFDQLTKLGILPLLPAFTLEVYPMLPWDVFLRSVDFQVSTLRRLFRLTRKKLWCITRGDIAGQLLDQEKTLQLSNTLRSRFDTIMVWGEYKNNARLMDELARVSEGELST